MIFSVDDLTRVDRVRHSRYSLTLRGAPKASTSVGVSGIPEEFSIAVYPSRCSDTNAIVRGSECVCNDHHYMSPPGSFKCASCPAGHSAPSGSTSENKCTASCVNGEYIVAGGVRVGCLCAGGGGPLNGVCPCGKNQYGDGFTCSNCPLPDQTSPIGSTLVSNCTVPFAYVNVVLGFSGTPDQLPDAPLISAMASSLVIDEELVNISSKVLQTVRRVHEVSRRQLDQTDVTFKIEAESSDVASSMVERLNTVIDDGSLNQSFVSQGLPSPAVRSRPSVETTGIQPRVNSSDSTPPSDNFEAYQIAIVVVVVFAWCAGVGFCAYRLRNSDLNCPIRVTMPKVEFVKREEKPELLHPLRMYGDRGSSNQETESQPDVASVGCQADQDEWRISMPPSPSEPAEHRPHPEEPAESSGDSIIVISESEVSLDMPKQAGEEVDQKDVEEPSHQGPEELDPKDPEERTHVPEVGDVEIRSTGQPTVLKTWSPTGQKVAVLKTWSPPRQKESPRARLPDPEAVGTSMPVLPSKLHEKILSNSVLGESTNAGLEDSNLPLQRLQVLSKELTQRQVRLQLPDLQTLHELESADAQVHHDFGLSSDSKLYKATSSVADQPSDGVDTTAAKVLVTLDEKIAKFQAELVEWVDTEAGSRPQ